MCVLHGLCICRSECILILYTVTNEDAIEVYTPERPYIVYTGSKNEKKLWLTAIRETIYNLLLREEKCPDSTEKSISKWWALDRIYDNVIAQPQIFCPLGW